MAEFRWTKRRERAALLVAQDDLTNEQIADAIGITRQCLDKWKRHPDFAARVDSLIAEFRAAVLVEGIADQVQRVKRQNDRWDRIQRLLDARAEANADLTGGDTGLVVREVTYLPGGATRERHEFDAAVMREARELEKQAAQELGQWTEKRELTGKDGGAIEVHVDDARERLAGRIASLADRLRAGGNTGDPDQQGSGGVAL